MRPRWIEWRSPLADGIVHYLTHKRALGAGFHVEELTLRLFDRFLVEQHITTIEAVTPDVVDAFLASRPRTRPRSYNHLLGTLARCCAWLASQRRLVASPVRARPRRVTSHRLPFLFDQAMARRLLEIARGLPDTGGTKGRGETYRTIFAVLYGLGLRVGEAARLTVEDVELDRQLLVIRASKFGKSRLVPFGPRLGVALADYLMLRRTQVPVLVPGAPLFSIRSQRAIHPCTISQTFHHMVPKLGLVVPHGVGAPRVHDLRHSFAVGTLLGWYQRGLDPNAHLLHLSTFLGHVDPASTAVYLTITPALMEAASQRFRQFAEAVFPEDQP